jgi:hypothetical protein
MRGIEEGWDGERKAPWEPRSFTELSGVGSREGKAKGGSPHSASSARELSEIRY